MSSRVDDERQAQRLAEKLALEKRQAEERAKEKQQAGTAFARLVNQGQQEKGQTQTRQSVLRAAYAQAQAKAKDEKQLSAEPEHRALEEALRSSDRQASKADARARAQLYQRAADAQTSQARTADGERGMLARAGDQAAEGMASRGRAGDLANVQAGADGRRQDQDQSREGLFQKGESALKAQSARARGAAGAAGDDLKAEGDEQSGGSGAGGGDKKKDGAEVPQGFRLNPALLAPIPVATPKDNKGSEKLRALANEIAQKIVERVRVGQNAAGKAEFQIDLRSTVLKGLSIKVSGGNGRISAVFSGSDRDVMKMLKDQEQSLRTALSGRGLTLAEFRIEERA